jgi:DNA polymerase III subunit gamma/tau
MFENLIAQPVKELLSDDISASKLPPSMLFSGQVATGKLTAALELARVLSCQEGSGLWTCACNSCRQHKELVHPDLLVVGPRDCILEIRAAAAAFLRNRGTASRFLFIRSARKLALRFTSVLQDQDDQRFLRAAPLLAELDERLEEIAPTRPLPDDPGLIEKLVSSIVAVSEKLEDEFLYDSIPVSQVRAASSWARLSPSGKKKVLIVENADRMQESARNAFLKVLEEPPENVVFILTTSRRGAIMPTILSRLRTYAFVDRSAEAQREVITRVFHDESVSGELLSAYFDRFLPVSPETVTGAAALFLSGVLASSIDEGRKPLSGLRSALGAKTGTAPIGEIVTMLNRCKPSIVYRLFLSRVARFMRDALRSGNVDARETAVYAKWTTSIRGALESVDVYNIAPTAALESLFQGMKEAL